MICLNYRVSIVQRQLLGLKEIIREVEVHSGAPCSPLLILMATGSWVMSYKNTLLGKALDTSLLGILSYTPCKIVHVFLKELPRAA